MSFRFYVAKKRYPEQKANFYSPDSFLNKLKALKSLKKKNRVVKAEYKA
jgi:hypothetical protein